MLIVWAKSVQALTVVFYRKHSVLTITSRKHTLGFATGSGRGYLARIETFGHNVCSSGDHDLLLQAAFWRRCKQPFCNAKSRSNLKIENIWFIRFTILDHGVNRHRSKNKPQKCDRKDSKREPTPLYRNNYVVHQKLKMGSGKFAQWVQVN